jgi:hypothetical protein
MFKDTVISANQKRREAWIILACFAGAFLFNVIGIIKFQTPAKEVFTQLHIVLFLCIFLYIISGIVRLTIYLVRRIL